MPKFYKIKLRPENTQCIDYGKISWRLVIENEIDLFIFLKQDNSLNMGAWVNDDPETHPRGRGGNMRRLMQVASLDKTKSDFPLDMLNGIFKLKAESMLRLLDSGDSICINVEGGFCGLKHYLDSWNGEILETIEKGDIGFPVDNDIINAETLVLENDFYKIPYPLKEYFNDNGITNYKAILNLKGTDMNYVMAGIKNAKTIALHSQFNDIDQVNSYLKFFSTLEPKKIILSSFYEKDLALLKHNPLFKVCESIHEIVYVYRQEKKWDDRPVKL